MIPVPSLTGRRCSRRGFLRLLGMGGAAAFLPLAGCSDDPFDPSAAVELSLADDAGVLNGLYALLQLKGDVFERLRRTAYAGKTRREAEALLDIVDHTAAHVQFVTRRLRERRIYDLLLFDLEDVVLNRRAQALAFARARAEETAAAHVWAAGALRDPALALVIAKMASVHARHAAVVRGFATGSDQGFAAPPAVTAGGRTPGRPLAAVLEEVRPYFRTRLQIRS